MKMPTAAYTGNARLIPSNCPPNRGAIIPPIRLRAEAVPHALPRIVTGKISGVIPYNTAHMVVAVKDMAMVLTVTAAWLDTQANTAQKNAVAKVLRARDFRRPSLVSIIQAPSYNGGGTQEQRQDGEYNRRD